MSRHAAVSGGCCPCHGGHNQPPTAYVRGRLLTRGILMSLWIQSGLRCAVDIVYADLVAIVRADIITFEGLTTTKVSTLKDDDQAYIVKHGTLACGVEMENGPKGRFIVVRRRRPSADEDDLRRVVRVALTKSGRRILHVREVGGASDWMTFEDVSRMLLQPMLLGVANAPIEEG